MFNSQIPVLSLFCSLCVLACLPQPSQALDNTVLASLIVEKDGNVPRGFQNAGDLRVFVDGRVQMIGSKLSMTNVVSAKHLKSFPDVDPNWATGDPLTAPKLDALRKAIDSTDFDQLQIDKNARRPSTEDAADRVAEFQKGAKKIVLRLWQVRNMSVLIPVLRQLQSCGRVSFGEESKTPLAPRTK